MSKAAAIGVEQVEIEVRISNAICVLKVGAVGEVKMEVDVKCFDAALAYGEASPFQLQVATVRGLLDVNGERWAQAS